MNMMSDLLTASSLLLAILTTMYSFFNSSITEFMNIKPHDYLIDNKENYFKGLSLRKTKILPMTLASLTLSVIFIPEAYKIFVEVIYLIRNKNFNQIYFDTIKASYCAVTIFMIVLSVIIIIQAIKFQKHLRRLNSGK